MILKCKKFFRSFSYALRGVVWVIRTQQNMWVHLFFVALAIFLVFCLSVTGWELAWVITAIFLVLSMETFNSALEAACDRMGEEYHPLVAKAKDAAAGAVLLAAIHAVIVGLIVFLPKIINLII